MLPLAGSHLGKIVCYKSTGADEVCWAAKHYGHGLWLALSSMGSCLPHAGRFTWP